MVLKDHLIPVLGLREGFSRDSPVLCRHSDAVALLHCGFLQG